MSNIMDYVEWRGDLSFQEREFNDVDNLILAELAYTDLRDILDIGSRDKILLKDAYRKYVELGKDQSHIPCDPKPLLEKCAGTDRFGLIYIKDFFDLQSHGNQFQFASMTFELGDGTVYVAFRGTDNTVAGWREDLNFSFMESTPAQLCAADYLDLAAERNNALIRVGGHSKGGNLAMFAAAFCEEQTKNRVVRVYSNDGPGFNELIVENPNYQNILDKVSLIIPEGSLIGILLFNKQEKQIVQSTGKGGADQHIPYSWLVDKVRFVQAQRQSSTSLLLDRMLDEWLKRLDLDKKRRFVDIVFDTIEASGALTFTQINSDKWTYYNAIGKAAMKLAPDQVGTVLEVLKQLLSAGKDVLMSEKKQKESEQEDDGTAAVTESDAAVTESDAADSLDFKI